MLVSVVIGNVDTVECNSILRILGIVDEHY